MDLLPYLFAGIIAMIFAAIGSLFMWFLVGNYIIKRNIRKLGEGEYDDVIGEGAVIAVNRILKDDELKKVVGGMIHGYAKSFGDQAMGMLKKGAEQYGISLDNTQMPGSPGGFAPDAIVNKILGSIFGD
jgi:hypothetical protein